MDMPMQYGLCSQEGGRDHDRGSDRDHGRDHGRGCDHDHDGYAKIMEEKKRKRMISNRESARRSRMKKEQHIKDLNEQIFFLQNKRREMVRKIDEIAALCTAVESENMVRRAEKVELGKRLECAEILCEYVNRQDHYVDGVGLMSQYWFDSASHVGQDPWLRSWQQQQQQPTQSMPIMSSAGFFQF